MCGGVDLVDVLAVDDAYGVFDALGVHVVDGCEL